MPDQAQPDIKPRSTAPLVSRQQVLDHLSAPDWLLVDVRRNDFEGGTIKGSINLPAQSFSMTRATLYHLCKRAGVRKIAFYCGSCGGRGPRCSALFADYIVEQKDEQMLSFTLEGGIKGWVKAGEPYTMHIDSFEPEYWKQFE